MLTFWLYGLSGSGKTTIADKLLEKFPPFQSMLRLDGDILRTGLSVDLGYTKYDRAENIRRAAQVCNITNQKLHVLATFMTPTYFHQEIVKSVLNKNLRLIYIDAPVDECRNRDPKGLYKKQSEGLIKNLSGVDSAFEINKQNNLCIDTVNNSIDDCVYILRDYIIKETKKC
tara:strand:+ start:24 stop:539 length:516 start_codon:yes stop_codon:yes gene_type:complete